MSKAKNHKYLCPICRQYASVRIQEPCELCANIGSAISPSKEVTGDGVSKDQYAALKMDDGNFFNPFNIKYNFLVGLLLFLALVYTDRTFITAVFAAIILAPVYSVLFWLAGLILHLVVTSGFDEGKAYALKKGHNPTFQILYGIIGIVIFLLIFG